MKKIISLVLVLMLGATVCLSFSSCGAEKSMTHDVTDNVATEKYDEPSSNEEYDYATEDSTTAENPSVAQNRKIIETISLTLQTKEFDKLVDKIIKQASKLGGYVEASEIEGSDSDYEDSRWAEITLRIPSDKKDSFDNYVSENSVVVNRAVSTEDVTLKYVDTESRVKALEAEKEALEKILKNATSVEDIIKVREQLTEVIYEIESLESQLRTYDNLIDFTTINITVDEVERTEITEKQTVWQKIGTNLKNNFSDMWSITVALFVFFISAIPFFIPLGVAIIAVLVIIKIRNKRSLKKNNPENK